MARIHKGGGAKYKDSLATAGYSVGDPPATHVRGLGLGPKYSCFMSSALGHRVADFIQKIVFFRGRKGCFWLENAVFARKCTKMVENGQK